MAQFGAWITSQQVRSFDREWFTRERPPGVHQFLVRFCSLELALLAFESHEGAANVAQLDYPVSGNLSVDVSMHGSQLSPLGNGSVRIAQGSVYGQRLQQFLVQMQGN